MASNVQAEVEKNFKNVNKPEWVLKIGKSILLSSYDQCEICHKYYDPKKSKHP
jgi:hypothetical protein